MHLNDNTQNLNDNTRDNFKKYKKDFETFFIAKYTERIDEETTELEKLLSWIKFIMSVLIPLIKCYTIGRS